MPKVQEFIPADGARPVSQLATNLRSVRFVSRCDPAGRIRRFGLLAPGAATACRNPFALLVTLTGWSAGDGCLGGFVRHGVEIIEAIEKGHERILGSDAMQKPRPEFCRRQVGRCQVGRCLVSRE